MKIAQVAPLYESVPPVGYGGTERVVSWLTEELVRLGHDVTLFASGDSQTTAKLIAGSSASLRSMPNLKDPLAHHTVMLEKVRKHRGEFDVIHFHTDYLQFPLCREWTVSNVTTLHGRLDLPDLVPVYREFRDVPLVSISNRQRDPLPGANWIGNVYHGLPANLLRFHSGAGKYLAFIGRMSPEKRPDRAIAIATAAGMRLRIAAKVDLADRAYFDRVIKPLLSQPNIEFLGEIGDHQKAEFLGNAVACLAPIDWPEPFGLNMIESMACGTPVIAFAHGSVPELIDDGVSGIIVESVEEAISAVERVKEMSRAACRNAFEERFTVRRMANDYLKIYQQLAEADMPFDESMLSELSEQEHEALAEDAA